jgi:hypothetical protein
VIEPLEARALLSASITIAARLPNASETDPGGAGRGQFIVRRSGVTTAPIVVNYHVRSTSTARAAQDFSPVAGRGVDPGGARVCVLLRYADR